MKRHFPRQEDNKGAVPRLITVQFSLTPSARPRLGSCVHCRSEAQVVAGGFSPPGLALGPLDGTVWMR